MQPFDLVEQKNRWRSSFLSFENVTADGGRSRQLQRGEKQKQKNGAQRFAFARNDITSTTYYQALVYTWNHLPATQYHGYQVPGSDVPAQVPVRKCKNLLVFNMINHTVFMFSNLRVVFIYDAGLRQARRLVFRAMFLWYIRNLLQHVQQQQQQQQQWQ